MLGCCMPYLSWGNFAEILEVDKSVGICDKVKIFKQNISRNN